MEPSEQFLSVKPDISGKRLSWDQVAGMYPYFAGDPGVHEVASWMTHSGGEAEPGVDLAAPQTSYRLMKVDLSDIEPGYPNEDPVMYQMMVEAAMQGYEMGLDVPPAVLVHRAGSYEIADGQYKIEAAAHLNLQQVEALVSESPHITPLDIEQELY